MPVYHIEDSETGVQLEVEGEAEPTQEDAHELMGQELDFLRTNVFEFPGGKFVLDVGPTKLITDLVGSSKSLTKKQDDIHNVWAQDKQKSPPVPRQDGEALADFYKRQDNHDALWQKEFERRLDTIRSSPEDITEARNQMSNHLPEGSVLILSHGSKEGGHYTDPYLGGTNGSAHKFTLSNLARVLGQKSSSISNVFDAACYGGKCDPSEYEAAFPNARSVHQIHTNFPNWVSTDGQLNGKFYGAEGTNKPSIMKWSKDLGKNWVLKP